MKKVLVAALMLCFVASGVVTVFAKGMHHKKEKPRMEMLYGNVVSVDKEKKEIVIKEEKTGETKAFQVEGSSALRVKVGQKVKLKIKQGNSIAESVKLAQVKAKK